MRVARTLAHANRFPTKPPKHSITVAGEAAGLGVADNGARRVGFNQVSAELAGLRCPHEPLQESASPRCYSGPPRGPLDRGDALSVPSYHELCDGGR